MAIVSLFRNTTQSAVTSRENVADRFQQKDNCSNLKESAKTWKDGGFQRMRKKWWHEKYKTNVF